MPNIAETLRRATEVLRASDIAEPRREAASLLALALGKDRGFLLAHSEYELSAAEETEFQQFLRRRRAREPFQYIAGVQEFYGLDFAVAPGVLIPRPETELLVETAIEILKPLANPRFCEVGVGSGAVSVAILHRVESASAIGADVSEKALQVTRKNAETHGVAARLHLRISDVFDAFGDEKFDLIASNPPYVPGAAIEGLQPEVRDFEPRVALTDNADGLSIIKKIITRAPRILFSGGFLLLEIGFGQAAPVAALFDRRVWHQPEILPDLQSIPRTVKAQIAARQ